MRRTILGGLFAVSLVVPSAVSAAPVRETGREVPSPQSQSQSPFVRGHIAQPSQQGNEGGASLGSGMVGGNDPGRVAEPERTPVDPSTRGPVNDVNPKTPPLKPVP
jgi:hypothetical protein